MRIFWLTLGFLWVLGEIGLVVSTRKRRSAGPDHNRRSDVHLWLIICGTVAIAIALELNRAWPLGIPEPDRHVAAMSLFTFGLYLRFYSVLRLGPWFTTRVMVQDGHTLITDGPYRWIRHPSYTGLLTSLIAAGIAMSDGLALFMLLVPNAAALIYRIGIEEAALRERFGASYESYAQRTKRLIPGLY
jgi:protein-S-isoprenylcysteine O-methyltransferase Ste14